MQNLNNILVEPN